MRLTAMLDILWHGFVEIALSKPAREANEAANPTNRLYLVFTKSYATSQNEPCKTPV